MTKIVNSWNDFDPLKHVIVGRADHSCIPPEEPATSEKVPIDSTMRGMCTPPSTIMPAVIASTSAVVPKSLCTSRSSSEATAMSGQPVPNGGRMF